MIIESGVIIFVSILLIAMKLPLRTNLKLLGRPLLVDLTASVVTYLMHMGTFSGVMAAVVAGLMVSGLTAFAIKCIGYIEPKTGTYVPGWWDMTERLAENK